MNKLCKMIILLFVFFTSTQISIISPLMAGSNDVKNSTLQAEVLRRASEVLQQKEPGFRQDEVRVQKIEEGWSVRISSLPLTPGSYYVVVVSEDGKTIEIFEGK